MAELREDANFCLLKLSELNPIQNMQDIKKLLPVSICPWQRWLNWNENKQTNPPNQKKIHVCRETLILTLTLTSYKGRRNVQLFSGCLNVWYPTAGCPPLLSQLEEGTRFQWAVLPSGEGPSPMHIIQGPSSGTSSSGQLLWQRSILQPSRMKSEWRQHPSVPLRAGVWACVSVSHGKD